MENHIYKAILQKFSFNFREYYSLRPKTQTGLRKIIFKIHLILKLSLQCQSIEILLRVFFPPFFFSLVHTIIYIYISTAYLITRTIANLKFVRRLILKLILTVSKFRQKKKKKQRGKKGRKIPNHGQYIFRVNISHIGVFEKVWQFNELSRNA